MSDTIEHVLPETYGELAQSRTKQPLWDFFLEDSDRSSSWSNHTYVLQLVCTGRGSTPQEAWAEARRLRLVPENFFLPENVKAIKRDDQQCLRVE